jgi:hypothetical protein
MDFDTMPGHVRSVVEMDPQVELCRLVTAIKIQMAR